MNAKKARNIAYKTKKQRKYRHIKWRYVMGQIKRAARNGDRHVSFNLNIRKHPLIAITKLLRHRGYDVYFSLYSNGATGGATFDVNW